MMLCTTMDGALLCVWLFFVAQSEFVCTDQDHELLFII